MLLQNVEEILDEAGFSYCEYRGCFDIAARRDYILLLKVLTNVDSFQEEQANNLKVLSRDLEAKSMLIGLHTRREALSDNIVYERFEVPAVTPKTLDRMLHGFLPSLYRFRGGLFVDINPAQLRKARKDAGMSQSQLAQKVGITKKSVYEHESGKLRAVYQNATKIERVLRSRIIVPLELRVSYSADSRPKSRFESKISRNFRRMGFETDSVYQSPFNMIAREKFLLLSDVDENMRRIERNIPYISDFSSVTKKPAIVVTSEEANFDIPSIKEEDLAVLSARDIRRLIKNW